MRGSMRQRGDSWQLRVYLGRDPLTGEKRWVSKTIKGGKREAQRALAAMVAAADDTGVAPSTGTVSELLKRWFENSSADFSPSTALETTNFMRRYIEPGLGRFPVGRLRTEDIDRLYRELRKRGGQNGKPLAPATVRRVHVIVHRSLEQAVRWGWIPTNPAHKAQVPRIPAPDIRPPSPSEVVRLFTLAEEADPPFATFLWVAAATGARRSELLALRWSDIDEASSRMTIARGLVNGPDGFVVKDTKTHGVRRVALDRKTIEMLSEHRGRAEKAAGACGVVIAPDAYVFSHEADSSGHWRPDSTTRAFRLLVKRSGADGVRLHDLRHYVATRLLTAGVDVRTVAGRLGHRNASTTLNVYAHFLQDADEHAAAVLADLLSDRPDPVTSGEK
jgi:integrase